MPVSEKPTLPMPHRVMRTARADGASEICLIGGPLDSCDECLGLVNAAFDHHYGHLGTLQEVVKAIRDDIENDIKELP